MNEPTDAKIARGARNAVVLLTLAYLFALLDRTVLTLLIGPIQQDLHITDTQFGLLQGLTFAIFYLLGGLPLGWLVDRTSRVRIITLGVAAWSVMTMLSGFAGSFIQLFLLRVGVGIGEASLNPATYSLLADWFPRNRLSRAIAAFTSGSMLGTGLAYAFGGALVHLFGARHGIALPIVGTMQIWQVAFLAAGAPGLVLALLLMTLREPPRKQHVAPHAEVTQGALITFLRQRRLVIALHFGAFSCMVVLIYSFFTWGPALLLRSHGLSAGIVGIIMGSATGIFGVLGFFGGGALADYWLRKGHVDAHMKVGVWAMTAALPVGLTVSLTKSPALASAGMCCLIFLLMAPTPAGVAGLQLITPQQLRGRISALFMVVANFAGLGLGPVLVPLLTDHVFGSKSAVNLSLAIITALTAPLSVVGFAFARRMFSTCLVEEARNSQDVGSANAPELCRPAADGCP
jgi:MFS family permease